jgi:hypothetical protein
MGGRTSQPSNMPLWLKGYFEQEALKKKKRANGSLLTPLLPKKHDINFPL